MISAYSSFLKTKRPQKNYSILCQKTSRCDRGKNRGIDFDAIDAKDPNLLDEIAEYFDYESRADLIYELTDIYELADSSELCAWFSGSIEDEGEEERGEELLERLENILD